VQSTIDINITNLIINTNTAMLGASQHSQHSHSPSQVVVLLLPSMQCWNSL
jgi:hypothetical protein